MKECYGIHLLVLESQPNHEILLILSTQHCRPLQSYDFSFRLIHKREVSIRMAHYSPIILELLLPCLSLVLARCCRVPGNEMFKMRSNKTGNLFRSISHDRKGSIGLSVRHRKRQRLETHICRSLWWKSCSSSPYMANFYDLMWFCATQKSQGHSSRHTSPSCTVGL